MLTRILIFKNDKESLFRVFRAHGKRPDQDTKLLEEIEMLGGCDYYLGDEQLPLLIVAGENVEVDDVLDVVREGGYDVDVVLSHQE